MEVQFKAYAQVGSGKEEIRRFNIEMAVVRSYDYLRAKLEDVFPSLRSKAYNIYYRDMEDDKITISSDSELILSLGNLSSDIYKLYIECENVERDLPKECDVSHAFIPPPFIDVGILGGGDGLAFEPSSSKKHYGVVCDGCEGEIIGYRYRCTVCRDYDLCPKCEGEGKHSEHCMLRIPLPITSMQLRHKFKRLRHLKNLINEEFCTEKKTEATECPFAKKQKRDKHTEGRHHRHGERRGRTSWLDTVSAYVNEFANLAGDVATAATAPPPPSATQAPSTTQAPPTPQAPPTASTSTQGTATNAENGEKIPKKSDHVQLLPNINLDELITPENMKYVLEIQKALADMLLPLGPDVAIPQDKTQATANPAAQSSETVNQASGPSSQTDQASGPSNQTDQASGPSNQTVDQASQSNQTVDQAIQSDVPMHQAETALERNASPERNDGWTLINNENEVVDTPAPPPPTPSAPAEAPQPFGFKELPQQFNDKVNISAAPARGLYPNIGKESVRTILGNNAIPLPPPFAARPPPQASIEHHSTPHLEAALQQMLSMGYTNTGGWLSQLIESKDGNINAVLDLLTPVTVKKQ